MIVPEAYLVILQGGRQFDFVFPVCVQKLQITFFFEMFESKESNIWIIHKSVIF